jgi:hypothetical protein
LGEKFDMLKYKEELNFDIKDYNHISDLSELMINGMKIPINMNINEDEKVIELTGHLSHRFREDEENVLLSIIFDKEKLRSIEVMVNNDKNKYNEYDLKYFYYDEIQNVLFYNRNLKSKKFTIRNYRSIYNSSTIHGSYQINTKNKFSFFSLFPIERSEPMTEHIICFDVEVEDSSLDRARSQAHNIVSDYTGFLSVLLDIGFEDINSKYVNYIKNDKSNVLKTERYRTGFGDDELNLLVKDNLNGLMHRKDMNKESLLGFMSYSSFDNLKQVITEKVGHTPELDAALTKHRLYKVNGKDKGTPQYSEFINDNIHYMNEPILIPQKIRKFFKAIEDMKENDYKKYIFFRNSCRLYNLSHTLGHISSTSQLAYLVSSIEVLSKTQNSSYTPFIRKYNEEADLKLLDYIYGKVRSGHFHSGEFLFHEFDVELNSSANPKFFTARNDLIKARSQLRKIFVEWINSELLKSNEDEESLI